MHALEVRQSSQIDSLELGIDANHDAILNHASMPGHPVMEERVADQEESLKEIKKEQKEQGKTLNTVLNKVNDISRKLEKQ